jgi:hypothetical protein
MFFLSVVSPTMKHLSKFYILDDFTIFLEFKLNPESFAELAFYVHELLLETIVLHHFRIVAKFKRDIIEDPHAFKLKVFNSLKDLSIILVF